MIRLPLWNPTGVPYTNGNVASVMPASFHKMRIDTVTWNVHNDIEEAEGDTEVEEK